MSATDPSPVSSNQPIDEAAVASAREEIERLRSRQQIGIIQDEDVVYERCWKEMSEALTQCKLLPFLGAGISVAEPSYLPLATTVTEPILNAVWSATSEVRTTLVDQGYEESVSQACRLLFEDTRMEKLFDALVEAFGDLGLRGFTVLDGRIPNPNHNALASLAVRGFLPRCITLNFDVLVETAVRVKGGSFATVCPLAGETLGSSTHSSPDLIVLKPHGSFAEPGALGNRLQHVAATLSQAGRLPMASNISAMGEQMKSSRLLLVAGYSDNDWDIFPILKQHASKIERVIWIEYADQQARGRISSGADILEVLTSEKKDKVLSFHKVLDFVESLGARGTILVGDCMDLFSRLQKELAANVPDKHALEEIWQREEVCSGNTPKAVLNSFVEELTLDRPRLGLTLAALLGSREEKVFLRPLLRWIASQAAPSDHELIADCSWRLAGSLHMDDRLRESIRVSKQALATLRKAHVPRPEVLADHYVWLGYQHLCLAAPSHVGTPFHVFALPWNILRGGCLLIRGARLDPHGSGQGRLRGRAVYYWVDFVHRWANSVLLLGPKGRFLWRPLFHCVATLYKRLFERFPEQRDVELYRMREIEACVLGRVRKERREEFTRDLDIIENSCGLTLNEHHLGNVFLYRALLHHENGRIDEARHSLALAEGHWSDQATHSKSGLRKVALFRRGLGLWRGGRATARISGLNRT